MVIGADVLPSTNDNPATPSEIKPEEALRAARDLHQRLLTENLPRAQKQQLARRISGLLFIAEASTGMPNNYRLLFLRLRTDADHRVGLDESEGIRHKPEILEHYDRLEAYCTDAREI